MTTHTDEPADPETEYDFRTMHGVVRGKYADRVVRLPADAAAAFADNDAVNAALREYLRDRMLPDRGGPP